MSANLPTTLEAAPYLDVSDPAFSIRSAEVMQAREQSWFARTPYGIAVLRYAEVNQLIRDQRLRQGSYAWPAHNNATGSFADWWMRMLLSQEGADHSRLRRLANPAFAPKLVKKLMPDFQQIADELIDGFIAKGSCEFVSEFAEPYATQVICLLLGLPRSEWRGLADLAVEMGLALGVTFKRDEARINAATDKLFGYARQAVSALKANGLGEDFLSSLVRANEENKEALSDQELFDMIVLAIFGGIDTTRNQISLAMDTFLQHPAQWELLGNDPELARAAVEEVMRVRPTVTWVTREALEDFEYQGLQIKRGTTIHLFSQSAGSDPRAFENAEFDITAKRQPHFGFGAGAHHCIGHFIARGDMTAALALLAQRVKHPVLAGEAEWLPDSGNTGATRLPIRFDAVARA
ncbi:cytochrome P450 [Pseudomonas panipatensis]|uniref:Cytochrome P450 n=1 Tax=Pseudomonas panipatensis TaxID=428992 RepID=A0A1G8HIG1_9PSED|nr:cytochrome P450 [Pseudomonas panipatensis]SDI06240.1 Cytochrome P450 [Pseudomonas panipatensis]SMP58358.1 Cytochrome P450 [Pseudomonas panipatensis]